MKTLKQASQQLRLTCLLEKSEGQAQVWPHEDTQASLAQIANHVLEKFKGQTFLPYEDTRARSARKTIAPHHMLLKPERQNIRVRDIAVLISPPSHYASLSISPLVTKTI
jgi:hypothetical protein